MGPAAQATAGTVVVVRLRDDRPSAPPMSSGLLKGVLRSRRGQSRSSAGRLASESLQAWHMSSSMVDGWARCGMSWVMDAGG